MSANSIMPADENRGVRLRTPEELIAQRPLPERGASRLLHLDGASGAIEDLQFKDLPG
jgi:S-adenosylmethionine:tRNA-ribosyltransferase-isomerase (queuine synthetase)